MKSLTLNIDPERLKKDPKLETEFLKMFGREQLNRVYSEESEVLFTGKEIKNMSEKEFAERRDEINAALAAGKVK